MNELTKRIAESVGWMAFLIVFGLLVLDGFWSGFVVGIACGLLLMSLTVTVVCHIIGRGLSERA